MWSPLLARSCRRIALPLAAYYAVTLVIPLMNGSARSGTGFVTHALTVLIVPLAVIALACAVRHLLRACASLCRPSALVRGHGTARAALNRPF